MPAATASVDADPPKTDRTITLSVKVPAVAHERLADLAWQRRSTASALPREAIFDHFPELLGESGETRAA